MYQDSKNLKIGMLAPISWRVPPRHYGPWEQVTSLLTEGLVRRGIDVTLFATADSITGANLCAVCDRPYSEDPGIDPKVWECLHISEIFERAGEFDIIHNNYDFLPITYSGLVETPVLTTIHGFSSEQIKPVFRKYNKKTYYVSISDADREPSLDYVKTIYHGIPVDEFTIKKDQGEYLLFFGRIHPHKGTVEAINTALKSGFRLIIAGIIQDREYYEKKVLPLIDGDRIKYIGPVGPKRRDEILGGAYALLHLISFNEPFGLSMIEAMACGTPVIAYGLGSIPEIIRQGENGFIVDSIEGAVKSLNDVKNLNRTLIGKDTAKRFCHDRMVDEYISVYREVIKAHKTALQKEYSLA